MNYSYITYGEIEVAWTPELDGGGKDTTDEFVDVIAKSVGKVDRLCEFCAGPSFIGFQLLARGLCNHLVLVDINPKAVEAMEETIRHNNLQGKVTIYLSDCLDNVPETEKWDVVVSNPPHFRASSQEEYNSDIIRMDHDWIIHQKFFRDVRKFLKPHGSVFMQECYMGCEETDIVDFIKAGGMKYIDSFMYRKPLNQWRDVYYFIWAKIDHKEFIWSQNPIHVVSLKLSELYSGFPAIRLAERVKYRFEITNDLLETKSVGLVNGIDSKGKDIPLCMFHELKSKEKIQSNIFYMTPGSYQLLDLKTRRVLAYVEAK